MPLCKLLNSAGKLYRNEFEYWEIWALCFVPEQCSSNTDFIRLAVGIVLTIPLMWGGLKIK